MDWTGRFIGLGLVCVCSVAHAAPSFEVSFSKKARGEAVTGRLVVIVSAEEDGEPRMQVSWRLGTAQIFGVDVRDWRPGKRVVMDQRAVGHPLSSLADLREGEYRVQAVLNVYETFRRADGHVLELPADDGEGQQWNRSPGNLYSEPQSVRIAGDESIAIELTEVIPAIDAPQETKYVRYVRIRSELLTKFWGRPMHFGAIVLVPEGFDDDRDARYPVLYRQGHFPSRMRFFRETPPEDGDRRGSSAYEFYQHWTSGRLPKMLIVLTQHATPFYDDSYGVNSANMGPWGDALTRELYPHIEAEFRAIGEAWARVLAGGSTGGWISLAQQIFYPDFFGGAWGFCPDPVDFHDFQRIDLYKDESGYYDAGPFKRLPKPLGRDRSGSLFATMEDFDRQEEALGSRGRSGGQWDAFHAAFGPVGPDGYPAELWPPLTGKIDPAVAAHWRENYDLTAILQRDWETLGPKLVGKLHITMGTKDTFYLEEAVYRMERFLESTKAPGKGPYYAGSVEYGDNKPHCYTGVPEVEGLNWDRHMVQKLADHMRRMAPEGANVESWYGR